MKNFPLYAVIGVMLLSSIVFAGDLTTRFPNGITTDEQTDLFGNFMTSNPNDVSGFYEDFYFFTLADWDSVSQVAAKTLALQDNQYGELLVQADTSTAYRSTYLIQTEKDNFQFNSGSEVWFTSRVKIGDVDSTEFFCGIYDLALETDTDSLGVVRDGIYFHKGIGTSLVLAVYDDSTGSTVSVTTAADSTYYDVGFYYDGAASVQAYLSGEMVGSVDTSNVPFDEDLPAIFGVIARWDTSSAETAHMWIDNIGAFQER